MAVHMQFKHTLPFTLALIDVRNVLIECDGVLKLHMHPHPHPSDSTWH